MCLESGVFRTVILETGGAAHGTPSSQPSVLDPISLDGAIAVAIAKPS